MSKCIACGCTDMMACLEGCWWVESTHQVCSSCVERQASKKTTYLEFRTFYVVGRKTPIVEILNHQTGEAIGQIRFYKRKYGLFPFNDMMFDDSCLSDINEMIADLIAERKKKAYDINSDI